MKKPIESKFPKLLPLNLQFFADPEDPPADPADPPNPPADPPADPPAKVEFSPEQQAELNRILGEKLGKAQTKWEKDYATKLATAKTEAEKLAKMNADQKAQYERDQQDLKLAEREAAITKRELKASVFETLAEKGLPKSLAEILVYTDADTTNASLLAVEEAFRSAVEAGVNDKLRGTPPGGGGKGGGAGTKNPFVLGPDWNLTEQGKLLKTDPEKYNQLKAQAQGGNK